MRWISKLFQLNSFKPFFIKKTDYYSKSYLSKPVMKYNTKTFVSCFTNQWTQRKTNKKSLIIIIITINCYEFIELMNIYLVY